MLAILSHLFLAPVFQVPNHVIERKAAGSSLGNEMIREFAQMPLAITAPERRFLGLGADKSANAAPRFQNTSALQLGVNSGDCIGIDAQIHRQLTDSRQLLADTQFAGGNCKPD